MTLRDNVWDCALEKVREDGKFKISDLPFEESERHTVRRVLKVMESRGWLQRDQPGSSIWRLGPKAKSLMKLDDQTIQRAKS